MSERYDVRPASRFLTVPGTVLLLVLLVAVWSAAIRVLDIGALVLPSPSTVVDAIAEKPGVYLRNGWNSAIEALLGLAFGTLAGVGLGAALVRRPVLRSVAGIYSSALLAMPVVALIPLANALFGFGTTPRVVVVALTVGPLMFLFALNGFRSADAGTDEMFRSIAASRWKTIWSFHLPAALPQLMSGLKVAAPTAFTVALLAEYFGGELDTLGTYIKSATVQLRVDNLWGAAFTAFAFAAVFFWVAIVLDRILVRRPSS